MSAPASAPASGKSSRPDRPATTRVTILTGRRMTDLVLPAAAPVEAYIDETVGVLEELLEGTPAEILAGFDFKRSRRLVVRQAGCAAAETEPFVG